MPLPRTLTTAEHADIDFRLVASEWPEDCHGEMFLSAPTVAHELRYALFGFGAIIRLSLQPGTHGAAADRFAWRHHIIDSPTKRLYDAAPESYMSTPMGYMSAFGSPNMANTAPLPWGDRLFATWDVGRPVELDPVDLTFLGEVGHKDAWGAPFLPSDALLPFYFSSAHPIIDPDRDCMWTVKLLPASLTELSLQPWVVRYDGDGTEVKAWPVAGASVKGSMHTISQTREWLILSDSGNFKADPGEMMTGVRTATIDDEVNVYLVRKDQVEATSNGSEVTPLTFPLSPTTGHYYGAYDDGDGQVRVLFEHMDRLDLGWSLAADDRDVFDQPIDPAYVGLYNFGMGTHSVSEVVFDPAKRTATVEALINEDWTWNQQLSGMDWSTEGISAPTLHHVVYHGFRPHNISQRMLAAYGDRIDRSCFPSDETAACLASFERGSLAVRSRYELPSLGDMPSSPIFVPRRSGSDNGRSRYAGADPGGHDGYVVCPVLSDDGIRIDLFDADDVGRGPIATLKGSKDECVPMLLHSAWAPAAVHPPSVERLRFTDELDDAGLAAVGDDELREVAKAVARDLDEQLTLA